MPESASGGGVCSQGVSAPGGVCFRGGVCSGGVSALGGGGWGSIPACTEAHPPVNRMTDICKNITLATTSLRPVNMICHMYKAQSFVNSNTKMTDMAILSMMAVH